MDVVWFDRCYNGGEFDVARCAYAVFGVIEDERVLSVKLSDTLAFHFENYCEHIRPNQPEKSEIMQIIARKLRNVDFKKKVISEYKNIVFVYEALKTN